MRIGSDGFSKVIGSSFGRYYVKFHSRSKSIFMELGKKPAKPLLQSSVAFKVETNLAYRCFPPSSPRRHRSPNV